VGTLSIVRTLPVSQLPDNRFHNKIMRTSRYANIGAEARRHWKIVDSVEATRYGLKMNNINLPLVGSQGIHDEVTLEDCEHE
jgi:hypothetical protein